MTGSPPLPVQSCQAQSQSQCLLCWSVGNKADHTAGPAGRLAQRPQFNGFFNEGPGVEVTQACSMTRGVLQEEELMRKKRVGITCCMAHSILRLGGH